MKIYYAHINFFGDDFYNKATSLIPTEKRQSAEKIRHLQTKKESILAWYIVSYLYHKAYNYIGQLPKLEYHANGKPSFAESDFHFNISHSEGFVCVAVADCEVGLDVQIIKPSTENLKKRVLSIGELSAVHENNNPDELFIDIWTKKESYLKFSGVGISYELKTLDFSSYLENDEFLYDGLYYNCMKLDNFRLTICSDKSQAVELCEFREDFYESYI